MALTRSLKRARDAAIETLRWVASFPFPDISRDYEFVALRHPDEYLTVYAHARSLTVKPGDTVHRGQVIAKGPAPEGEAPSKLIDRRIRDLGDCKAAFPLYDQAIALREGLVERDGRPELAEKLAGTYFNKAVAVNKFGDHRAAVALYDLAITMRERLERANRRHS